MKKTHFVLAFFGFSLFCLGYVQAQPILSPYGSGYVETAPQPLPPGVQIQESYYLPEIAETQPLQPYVEGAPVFLELYSRVTYRDTRKVHPSAIPYLVQVPLYQPRRACASCVPECALVKICVPPCNEPCVRVRRNGHVLIYDFGKYCVKVTVRRNNHVIVNYGA